MNRIHFTDLRATARGVAHAAHLTQKLDRDGQPHIAHVARVVELLEADGDDGMTIAAAWLHDVVEDTAITLEYLARMGFPVDVVAAVRLLTRDPEFEGTYLDYVAEIVAAYENLESGAWTAAKVKRADLEDNIVRATAEGNASLVRRYRRAQAMIEAAREPAS